MNILPNKKVKLKTHLKNRVDIPRKIFFQQKKIFEVIKIYIFYLLCGTFI